MLKQCGVCNKEFEPCNDCSSSSFAWRKTVCCIDHFIPFITILEYKRGTRTKEDAKSVLEKVSNIDYNNVVKDIVDEILATPVVVLEDETEEMIEVKPVTKSRKNK